MSGPPPTINQRRQPSNAFHFWTGQTAPGGQQGIGPPPEIRRVSGAGFVEATEQRPRSMNRAIAIRILMGYLLFQGYIIAEAKRLFGNCGQRRTGANTAGRPAWGRAAIGHHNGARFARGFHRGNRKHAQKGERCCRDLRFHIRFPL